MADPNDHVFVGDPCAAERMNNLGPRSLQFGLIGDEVRE
jgi:hypothetical protein